MESMTVPDFNIIFDRRNTYSSKWDRSHEGYAAEDLIPMWVADMDFQAPEQVLKTLHGLVDHGIFGYSIPPDRLVASYTDWVRERQNATLQDEWLLRSGKVLGTLALAIRTLTEPGDGVILQPPIYHPFAPLIRENDRHPVANPLTERDGAYTIDFEQLDEAAKEAKALLLCNPHNPVGRVFTGDELHTLLDICTRHSLLVISDEIHSDIIMPGKTHIPLFSLAGNYDVPMVVLSSPTKTFNLAGIPMAWAIVPDDGIRRKMEKALRAAHTGAGSHFAVMAALTAYSECAPWLDALLEYIDTNRVLLENELSAVPEIKMTPLEGTYLAWLDFRKTGVDPNALRETILSKTGLWLNSGETFGTGGAGFQRLNLAAPKSVVRDAGKRIVAAFS